MSAKGVRRIITNEDYIRIKLQEAKVAKVLRYLVTVSVAHVVVFQ